MNIQDAIKVKKRFKLSGEKCWRSYSDFRTHSFTAEELLSNQWIVEEKTITISESQFDEAWHKCTGNDHMAELFPVFKISLKKELGF